MVTPDPSKRFLACGRPSVQTDFHSGYQAEHYTRSDIQMVGCNTKSAASALVGYLSDVQPDRRRVANSPNFSRPVSNAIPAFASLLPGRCGHTNQIGL